MKTKEQLHEQLSSLVKTGHTHSMIGHALIELGVLTNLECAYDECQRPSKKLKSPALASKDPDGMSLDHAEEQCNGGTDMPWNLQFVHNACNWRKGAKASWTPERHEKHRKWMEDAGFQANAVKKRWAHPEAKKKASKSQKAAWAKRSPAERTASALKAWETRRKNANNL